MSYQMPGAGAPDEQTCFYGQSRLPVRAPLRDLEGDYLACLGGAETFGRFVPDPFPALLERRLGQAVINLGSVNCGVDAILNDTDLIGVARRATICVLQPPAPQYLSNRFYRVHPRRNDRFLKASDRLRALFPEVDFTEFNFAGHLLTHLHGLDPDRFDAVREEVSLAWVRRMQRLIEQLGKRVLVLWLRRDAGIEERPGPVPVTEPMMAPLGQQAVALLDLPVRGAAQSDELGDMLFGTLQQPAAEQMLGPATHDIIADALARAVRDLD